MMPSGLDPKTNRKYHLICQVRKIRRSWRHVRGNLVESDMVLLVPVYNDECGLFLNAWLPDMADEHFELAAVIGSPIFSPARLSIHRKGNHYTEFHYLFVMSEGVAKDLLKLPQGTRIEVTVMSELDDTICDEAKDDDILRDYESYNRSI